MMLNTNLAALSLDGKRFFYENMLRRAKKLDYKLIWPLTRSEYILSYCCPPNLARTIAQSSEYAYLTSDNSVWTGMYGASEAQVKLENGGEFTLVKDTSLAANITVMEMFMSAQRIAARTYEPFALYCEVGIIYLIFCTALTRLQSVWEQKLRLE